MKVIDLQFNRGDPFFMKVKVKHKPHKAAELLVRLLGLPGRLIPKDFVGWADDTVTKMGVHATTHIDAPWNRDYRAHPNRSRPLSRHQRKLASRNPHERRRN